LDKRTTIFKQLILNVVIPAILAMMALGIINVQQTWSILAESSENKSTIISEEIRQIHQFQDMAMSLLELQIDPILEKNSNTLINEVFKSTEYIETANLDEIRENLGMIPENADIYVINKEGIVVNSTFEQDLGLNLFAFGEEHQEMLESVWHNDKFFSEKFTIENNTRRLKKFTYIPTLDGNYLIELGIYSSKADSIIDFVKERMNSMSTGKDGDISVRLFIGKDPPICLNGDEQIATEYLEEYREALETKQKQTIEDRKLKPPVRIEYIFMERKNTSLYKESVIRIISDTSQEIAVVRRELLKFVLIFIFTVIVVIILLYRKTRVITDPIKNLVSNVNRITAGHFSERADVIGNNEITSLSEQFNEMIAQLESYYNELEEKVRIRTAEVVAQKEEIEAQRDTLQEQRNMLAKVNDSLQKAYTEIEDSIHYASRIQNAILPPDDFLKKVIPNAFFFYKPRDIVSGDFYWVAAKDDKVVIAAVDCTGHGVPGAFMSIVGNNTLNYALNVENATQPSRILEILDQGVSDTLRQTNSDSSVHDGMDLAMVTIDKKKNILQYSGAFNPLILIRDGEVEKIKADRTAIGGHIVKEKKSFTNHEIEYKEGDVFYMYSDGYADQFGGVKGGKYMSGKFVKFLQSIHHLSLEEQYEKLDHELITWRGEEPQIDDILVIGIKV
jgi:phosphoserine phosphatase RsbU/P